MSLIERAKIERQYKELNPNAGEINSCVMKVLIETRELFSKGSLKYDKIDPQLAIPDDFEEMLERGISVVHSSASAGAEEPKQRSSLPPPTEVNTTVNVGSGVDMESLKKKVIELSQQLNLLKKENMILRDKLERIRKIA